MVTAKPANIGIKVDSNTVITEVATGSQGERLGLCTGMRVLSIDGTAVTSSAAVTRAFAACKRAMKRYKIELQLPVQKDAVESDSGSAVSTKTVTEQGHKVTTMVSGTTAVAAAPIEPDSASLVISDAGCPGATADKVSDHQDAEAAAAAAAAEAEAQAELLRRQDGKVTLKYEMYEQQFEITGGGTTAAAIDAEYCLSFVMPKCRIHLSELDGTTLTSRMVAAEPGTEGAEKYAYYVREDPEPMPPPDEDGNVPAFACNVRYNGLLDGNTYYVYITQDSEEEAKAMAKAKEIWARADKGVEMSGNAAERRQEGCSCIEGNPCVNEYICLDWHNRFAVAAKHGWKAPGCSQ